MPWNGDDWKSGLCTGGEHPQLRSPHCKPLPRALSGHTQSHTQSHPGPALMAPPEMERASTTGAAAKGRTPQVHYVYRSLLTIGPWRWHRARRRPALAPPSPPEPAGLDTVGASAVARVCHRGGEAVKREGEELDCGDALGWSAVEALMDFGSIGNTPKSAHDVPTTHQLFNLIAEKVMAPKNLLPLHFNNG